MEAWEPNYALQTDVDADYGCFIWHDGSPTESGTAVSAATCAATGDTSITLTINGAVDTRIGASGVIAHATYGTWGIIADHINKVQGWHCQLRDVLRDQLPDNLATVSAADCLHTQIGINQDTSDIKNLGAGICNWKANTIHRQSQVCIYYFTGQCTDSGSPILYIYDVDDESDTEQLVHYYALTTATEYPWPTNGPIGKPLYVAPPGHRIVCTIDDGASMTAGRINVIGGIRYID